MNRRLLLWLVLLVVMALAMVGARLRFHESASRVINGRSAVALSETPSPLVAGRLEAGREAVFEVCSAAFREPDAIPPGLTFAVRDIAANAISVSRTFDAPLRRRVVRSARFGCVVFAETTSLGVSGRFAILASSDVPIGSPFVGRMVSRARVERTDGLLVAGLALLAVAALFVLSRDARPKADPDEVLDASDLPDASDLSDGSTEGTAADTADPPPIALEPAFAPDARREAAKLVGVAVVALGLGFGLTMLVPFGGGLGGLTRGAILIAAQVAVIAVVVVASRRDPDPRTRLATTRPRLAWLLLGAPVLAIGVQTLAQLLLVVIPSTGPSAVQRLVDPTAGIAHVETILAPFAGLVAFGAIAVLAPIVEELFYRGVVFGAIERALGANAATVLTALGFVLAHVPQLSGARAALASITVLSIAATVLRRYTGSVVVPAAMHVVHNALIVGVAFWNAK